MKSLYVVIARHIGFNKIQIHAHIAETKVSLIELTEWLGIYFVNCNLIVAMQIKDAKKFFLMKSYLRIRISVLPLFSDVLPVISLELLAV